MVDVAMAYWGGGGVTALRWRGLSRVGNVSGGGVQGGECSVVGRQCTA